MKLIFPKSNVWNQLLIVIFHEKLEPSSSTSFGSWLWLWHLTIPTKLLYFLLSHLYKSNAWVNGKNCQKMCILIGAWKLSNFSSLIKDMNFNNLHLQTLLFRYSTSFTIFTLVSVITFWIEIFQIVKIRQVFC